MVGDRCSHQAPSGAFLLPEPPFPNQCAVNRLYFLGLINSEDLGANFIGETISSINVVYEDLTTTEIPLILGFTAWYYKPWTPSTLPFYGGGSPPDARESLDACICLKGLGLEEDDPKQSGSYFLSFGLKRSDDQRNQDR